MALSHPPLFVPNRPARRSDPSTSKAAADELLADPNRLGKLQRRARALVKKYPDHTAREISEAVGDADPATTRRRLSEIARAGWIEVVARRKCRVTGKVVAVYRYVPNAQVKLREAKPPTRDELVAALKKYGRCRCRATPCSCGFADIIDRL